MSGGSNPTSKDRLLDSLRSLVLSEIQSQRLNYAGWFEYTIDSVHGDPPDVTLDCTPTDASLGLPDLSKVSCQPGIDGITAIPTAGMNCVVSFLNRDPASPRIVGVDSLGVNPVARLGDQVTLFLPPSMPIVGLISLLGPFAGVATVASPITGTIIQGSGKVFTG